MILRHCRPGTEVLTPLGRTAVIIRQRGNASNVDIFDRVELRYLDVPEDKSGHRGHLVDLQPKLLTSLDDSSGKDWKARAQEKKIPLAKMFLLLHQQ